MALHFLQLSQKMSLLASGVAWIVSAAPACGQVTLLSGMQTARCQGTWHLQTHSMQRASVYRQRTQHPLPAMAAKEEAVEEAVEEATGVVDCHELADTLQFNGTGLDHLGFSFFGEEVLTLYCLFLGDCSTQDSQWWWPAAKQEDGGDKEEPSSWKHEVKEEDWHELWLCSMFSLFYKTLYIKPVYLYRNTRKHV